MKERTKHIAQLIKLNIKEIDPDAQVILYGSRARGEERKESDWDILVLTNYPVSTKKERQFRDHLYDLELEVEEPFSMFIFSKDNWENKQKITPFYYSINKTGIKL